MYTNDVLGTIELIRVTPSITKEVAKADLEARIGDATYTYLDWCVTQWYRYGILTAETFVNARNRIQAMDETQYQFAKNKMASLGAEKIVKKIEKKSKEDQIAALDVEIASYTPKTIPDQETLDHWNATSFGLASRHMAILTKNEIQAQLNAMEED